MQTPDIDINFIELARNFSESFRSYYNPSTFSSNDGEWEIAYVNDEHYNKTNNPVTFARISNNKKRIEISKSMSQHEAITNNFMFYTLIRCYIHWYDKDKNLVKSDILATQYYLTQNRPSKDILMGSIQTISSGYSTNKERFEKMAEKLGYREQWQRAIDDLKKEDEANKVDPEPDVEFPEKILQGSPATKEDIEYAMKHDKSKDIEVEKHEKPPVIGADAVHVSEESTKMKVSVEDGVLKAEELKEGEQHKDGGVVMETPPEEQPYCPSHFYFMDTEFHEYKKKRGFRPATDTIELISIGIVSGDEREYYAVCKDFNLKAAWNNEWLRENVLKKIHKELCAKVGSYGKTYHSSLFSSFTIKSMKNLIKWYGKTTAEIRAELLLYILDNDGEGLADWNGSYVDYLNLLMKEEIRGYKPKFFTYFGSYDWVVFCWIFGRMIDLPKSFPMYTLDLKQFMWEAGLTTDWKREVVPEPEDSHSAIADARWNRELFLAINKIVKPARVR